MSLTLRMSFWNNDGSGAGRPVSDNACITFSGSCPGVGIIELANGGVSGKLVTVLRTINTVDNAPPSAPGGVKYKGNERSDPHGAWVRTRVEDIW